MFVWGILGEETMPGEVVRECDSGVTRVKNWKSLQPHGAMSFARRGFEHLPSLPIHTYG